MYSSLLHSTMHYMVSRLFVFIPYVYFTVCFVSEKDVKQMRAERKQMLQKIIDDDEHWEKAEDELTEVLEQYSIKKDELDKQERLIIKEDHEAVVRENICLFSTYNSQFTP